MDETQILSLVVAQQNKLSFTMLINELTYTVESFSMINSQIPVTKPTMRGGVYFSKLKEFKINAKFSNTDLSAVLSKTMLGPNSDFKVIKFLTTVELNGEKKQLALLANLTNYVQRKSGLELNLIVVGTELSD
jgi:hypothetical protein